MTTQYRTSARPASAKIYDKWEDPEGAIWKLYPQPDGWSRVEDMQALVEKFTQGGVVNTHTGDLRDDLDVIVRGNSGIRINPRRVRRDNEDQDTYVPDTQGKRWTTVVKYGYTGDTEEVEAEGEMPINPSMYGKFLYPNL